MKLIGKTEITTIELRDELQLVVVRKNGLLILVFPPALCVAITAYGFLSSHWMYVLIGIFMLGSCVAWYLNGPVTRLFVSRFQLIARGNVDRTFKNEIIVPASEVKFLGFQTGDDNGPAGLYVSREWRQTCMLPGLSKKQTIAIADVIHTKFPQFVRKDSLGTAYVLN